MARIWRRVSGLMPATLFSARDSVAAEAPAFNHRTYAVGVRGRLRRPRKLLFLAGFGHECGRHRPKRKILDGHPEGTRALQTSHRVGDCVSPVNQTIQRRWAEMPGVW